MGKKISTYYHDSGKGWCEIHLDSKDESLYIKYFNESGIRFFTEEFPNKSMRYVQDTAENWALGIKKLETN
jgi:hypothetical protein